ncbi:hypothetical protein F5Y07DRAFT_260563 [Xylaria sp. FL0933]|nr:hypothetical protein F5Y07DRAFT_260563 [Xylaria sp. FL0933]
MLKKAKVHGVSSLLSVRTKRVSSVGIARIEDKKNGQVISGDCAILYGQDYSITIASYEYELVQRPTEGPDEVQSLKDLTTRGYEDAMQRLKDVRSRDLSIPESSTAKSWYITRLKSVKAPREIFLPNCGYPQIYMPRRMVIE